MDGGTVHEDSRSDDMFANSSTETVVQNIDFSLILREASSSQHTAEASNRAANSQQESFTAAEHNYRAANSPQELLAAAEHSYRAANSPQELLAGAEHSYRAANSPQESLAAAEHNYRAANSPQESFASAEHSYRAVDSQESFAAPADPSYRAECFVSDVCNFALQLHCPFCCKYFAFEHLLKEHIKFEHDKYWEMLRSDGHILLLHSCLFCHAKYYKKQVLLKHILYGHQEVVVATSQKDQLCVFCPYTTVAPSRSKLLHHVEQNHATEFESLVDGMYMHNGQLENTMASSQHTFASFPSTSRTANKLPPEVLSPIPKSGRTIRKRLRFDEPDEEQCKNVAVPRSRTSKWKTFLSFMKLKKSRDEAGAPKFTTSTPKALLDRNLLMDNDIYYIDYDAGKKLKETSFKKTQKKRFSLNIFSRKKNKYRSLCNKRPSEVGITPTRIFKRNVNVRKPACGNSVGELSCKWAVNDEYKIKQFKCAVCLEAFSDNVGLVCHAKRHHNGPLRLLQPSFKCGLCEATFYKNSFLLRHCKFHHTPLCLRS